MHAVFDMCIILKLTVGLDIVIVLLIQFNTISRVTKLELKSELFINQSTSKLTPKIHENSMSYQYSYQNKSIRKSHGSRVKSDIKNLIQQ